MKKFLLFILSSFIAIGSFTAIDVLFYLNKGINFQQISYLAIILNITVLLAEVPTGILGDRLGSIRALMLGSLLRAIACIMYIVDFPFHLYLAAAVSGLSLAFYTGSINAVVFYYKFQHTVDRIFAQVNFYRCLALSLGGVIGYALFQLNPNYPWLLASIFMLLSILPLVWLKPPTQPYFTNKSQSNWHAFIYLIRDLHNKTYFWAAALNGLSTTAPLLTWQFFFQKFTHGVLLGFLFMQLASILASRLMSRFSFHYRTKFMFMCINTLAILIIPLLKSNLWLLNCAIFLHTMAWVTQYLSTYAQFHENIADSLRNTSESFISATHCLLIVPVNLLVGYLLNSHLTFTAFIISALISLLSALLYLSSVIKQPKQTFS
ncbi:MAG: MFS transporter [Neisseriaceae bacterium]